MHNYSSQFGCRSLFKFRCLNVNRWRMKPCPVSELFDLSGGEHRTCLVLQWAAYLETLKRASVLTRNNYFKKNIVNQPYPHPTILRKSIRVLVHTFHCATALNKKTSSLYVLLDADKCCSRLVTPGKPLPEEKPIQKKPTASGNRSWRMHQNNLYYQKMDLSRSHLIQQSTYPKTVFLFRCCWFLHTFTYFYILLHTFTYFYILLQYPKASLLVPVTEPDLVRWNARNLLQHLIDLFCIILRMQNFRQVVNLRSYRLAPRLEDLIESWIITNEDINCTVLFGSTEGHG